MVFTGTFEHSIDAKNRLAIPAEIRTAIARSINASAGEPVPLFVTMGEGQSLSLYTEPDFEKQANKLDESAMDATQLLEFERVFFSNARRVEMDKQGRVRLPESMLKLAGLAGDVVLLGVKDHLEIRDRSQWYDYLQQVRTQRPELVMNPRRAMKPGSASP